MQQKQFIEHRWGTRINVDVPAEVTDLGGRADTATIRDASVSGAFVETSAKFPLLSRIYVRPLSRTGLGLDAFVVRKDDRGFAVEWFQPGASAVSSLLPPGGS